MQSERPLGHWEKDKINADNVEYFKYTRPARLDKAIHTLEGLLKGIAADGVITPDEVNAVRAWIEEHAEFLKREPFRQILIALDKALADEVLEEDEIEDLLWLCKQFRSDEAFFGGTTSDMQRLQGILGGVAVDARISADELRGLRQWMESHEHLKGCWPYDEVDTLISAVLQDGKIDEGEHALLATYFAEFLDERDHKAIDLPLNEVHTPVTGLCGMCPEVHFTGRAFCFTGKSTKLPRTELAMLIEKHGGRFTKRVARDVDYLIIGSDGNEAWAYACYGRKVEQAIRLRKAGHGIQLVHEFDFWDAVAAR